MQILCISLVISLLAVTGGAGELLHHHSHNGEECGGPDHCLVHFLVAAAMVAAILSFSFLVTAGGILTDRRVATVSRPCRRLLLCNISPRAPPFF